MISTPDLISVLRKLYIHNDGIISVEELLPLLEENNLRVVDIEELFASILRDLAPPKELVLPFKEVNRFLLLQKAIESKESSSVCQEVSPHLYVLKENLNHSAPDCELSVKAAREIQKEIRPFAEKLPKLVKALNDYALLCEKYFSDITLLKRLVLNIRLFPLAEEANKQVENQGLLFTAEVYWDTAERLYKSSLSLFNDHLFNYSVVRAFLDEAMIIHKLPPLEIVLPISLSLTEAVVEEPVAVIEEPVAVVEEPAAVVEEPVAVIEEPAAVVEEPATVVEEPAAVVEEPATVVEEPAAVVEEPATVVEEPVTTIEKPAAVVEEPAAVVEEPSLSSENSSEIGTTRKKAVLVGVGLITLCVLAGGLFFYLGNQREQDTISLPSQPTQERLTDTLQSVAPSSATSQEPKTEQKTEAKDKAKTTGETQPTKQSPTKPEVDPEAKASETQPVKPKESPKAEPKVAKDTEVTPTVEVTPKTETPEVATVPKGDVSSSAFDALLKKAKGRNASAQYQVAQCYEKGTGVKADLFEAITWYRKAKINGSKPAEERLIELGY